MKGMAMDGVLVGNVPSAGIIIDVSGSTIGGALTGARQLSSALKRRIALSMLRSATAAIVCDGFAPMALGRMEPSRIKRFGYPKTSPFGSVTPPSRESAIRHPPRLWTETGT